MRGSTTLFNAVFINPKLVVHFWLCGAFLYLHSRYIVITLWVGVVCVINAGLCVLFSETCKADLIQVWYTTFVLWYFDRKLTVGTTKKANYSNNVVGQWFNLSTLNCHSPSARIHVRLRTYFYKHAPY